MRDTMPGEMPDFDANPSQRTPCVLVLDASASMEGDKIDELNKGLADLVDYLQKDETARLRVQVSAIVVGGPPDDAVKVCDWTDAKDMEPFQLEAENLTPLGKGINMAVDMVEEQKQQFRSHGINYTRPWIVIITDGAPNDKGWEKAAQRARQAENAKHCMIYPLAVDDANQEILQKFAETPVAKLSGVNFREFFQWLSDSMSTVSRSSPGERVQLPSPDAWKEIKA